MGLKHGRVQNPGEPGIPRVGTLVCEIKRWTERWGCDDRAASVGVDGVWGCECRSNQTWRKREEEEKGAENSKNLPSVPQSWSHIAIGETPGGHVRRKTVAVPVVKISLRDIG